jgi:hypothetical protein
MCSAEDYRLAIVVRQGKLLVRTGPIPLPGITEVEDFILPIERVEYGRFTVVNTSTGDPPDGWEWVEPIVLQNRLDPKVAAEVGEALVCAA